MERVLEYSKKFPVALIKKNNHNVCEVKERKNLYVLKVA